MRDLLKQPYYNGYLSFQDACLFLFSEPCGSYLVRVSGSCPGAFVLHWVGDSTITKTQEPDYEDFPETNDVENETRGYGALSNNTVNDVENEFRNQNDLRSIRQLHFSNRNFINESFLK